jgi:UDP-galactopyranose mutase
MNSNIDFLIVGAGLYGATIARLLTDAGFNCLIIDKRDHIAGNIYTERIHGYDKHVYGPHIFHTDKKEVEDFIKKYTKWIPFFQNTIATDGKKIYHLPFNMNTYYDIFGVYTPMEAQEIIGLEIAKYGVDNPKNLEEQAINLVGKTIYEILIKNYTEKQWGKKCTEIPPDIIKRIPLRYSFNNNYFNDRFQAIPKDGYTQFVKNIIGDIPYLLNWNFNYNEWHNRCKCIIYCGAVDELLDYQLGELEWRSLKFEDISFKYDGYNGQGMAIKNDVSTSKYTRYVEHMWFMPSKVFVDIISIITKEQPDKWERGKERYYSVNNANTEIKYDTYRDLLMRKMPEVELGGRLGKYKYFDMDDTIYEAMRDAEKLIQIHRK